MTYDSRPDTEAHIARVRALLRDAQANLGARGSAHDASKLEEPEKDVFDIWTPALRQLPYGTPGYAAALAAMGVALEHHYAHNRHHPQYHARGIADMTLFDLIEMICDWKAAGERHTTGGFAQSLVVNRGRFGVDSVLLEILSNTARELGWIDDTADGATTPLR